MSFELSICQQKAMDALTAAKENYFLTGHAGTGKSFLIRNFLATKDRKVFPILASTGTAAILVGGRTFHSFFGLGIMEGGIDRTVERALANKRVVKRLKDIEGFVLDEVSMISGPTLEAAETICRLARKIRAPWGGARALVTGDFSQLPPVSQNSKTPEWAFLNPTWRDSDFQPLLLKTVIRTQDDEYTKVLNDVRQGMLTDETREYLNRKTDNEAADDQNTTSTFLVPRRDTAEQFNVQRLARIKSPLHEIATEYKGDPRHVEALEKQGPIPKVLQIKESALVMIRMNDPAFRFVNGSLATVVSIRKDELDLQLKNKRIITLEKHAFAVQDADGKDMATATNFPLSLAYATTIHKSQGSTLDVMTCDLRRLWEPGHAYVALSRLRTGAGLTLIGWDEGSITKTDPHVKRFYETLA